ncbi:MAG: hypothetical protein Q8O67_04855 [Deltaproteobacteria bacterium]|nr:hypothetical protein [Deltaproteobacteria bacterium]
MTSPTMNAAETRAAYPDSMTLREARTAYFARTGFDDKTYVESWVKLPVGPFSIYMPNFQPRKEAVKIHDLNHILGGYGTSWQGEFEISAFEIGMGTGRYWFGWFLDVGGVAAGLLRFREPTLQAFARGRRTARSCYREIPELTDAILDGTTVGELRERVQVPDDATPTPADKRAALGWGVVGAVLHGAPLWAFVVVVVAVYLAL